MTFAARGSGDRSGSSFTALTRSIHELGLMRRRRGYYWAKLIGAVLILAAWVVGFTLIGDNWWQLVNAGVFAVVMTEIAGRDHHDPERAMRFRGRLMRWLVAHQGWYFSRSCCF